jgi:hypothetical protein
MPPSKQDRFPEDGPPLPLPSGVKSFGDPALDRLMAVALAAGATIRLVQAAPVTVQLSLFENAA